MTIEESTHDGVVPDLLKEIEAYTGLTFSYVYAKSYMDAIHMVKDGQADIMGFYLDSEKHAAELGLAVLAPYGSLNNIIVRNKTSSCPDDGLIGGIVEGRELPANVPAEKVITCSDMNEAQTKPEAKQDSQRLKDIHILLAEDNDLNAEIAMELLKMQGAVICWAIRTLSRPDAASVPIVAMTANTFQEDVNATREAGMNDFLAKPLEVERLYQILQNVTEGMDY